MTSLSLFSCLAPSLQLNLSSISVSQGSDDQTIVSCVLNNSPNQTFIPSWINNIGDVISETPLLTLSANLFPNSTTFFCVVQLSSIPKLTFNYVVLIANDVLTGACSASDTASTLADCSDQLAIIASTVDPDVLLSTLGNILNSTNATTLSETAILSITSNVFVIVDVVQTAETDVIAILDGLTNLFAGLVNTINGTLFVEFEGIMVQSQVILNTGPVSISLANSNESVNINISVDIIGLNPRVTLITSNVVSGSSVAAGDSGVGVIVSTLLSISIAGLSSDTVLDPPVELLFPLPTSLDLTISIVICVFWNENTQQFESTGLPPIVLDGQIICPVSHFTSFAILQVERQTENIALRVIAYILLALSIIALSISLVLFMLSGRRFFDVQMNRMFFNYALALLLANATLIFGVNLGVLDKIYCIIASLLVHYFWLAVFSWGLAIAILIIYLIAFGMFKKRKLFWFLAAFGWLLPLPIVILTFVFGLVRGDYVRQDEQCFLTMGYIWSMLGPILAIVVLNAICYVVAIVAMIFISVRKIGGDKKENLSMLIRALFSGIILLPVLAVPWIVIFFDFVFARYGITSPVFEWVFLILIGSSGIIFLLVFTLMNKAVQRTLRGKFCGRDKSHTMSAPTVEGATNPRSKKLKKEENGKDLELENVYTQPRDIIYSNRSAVGGDEIVTDSRKDQEDVFPENTTDVSHQEKETTMI